jgi:protein pelota
MKCSKISINKNSEGTINVTPEDTDDIWLLYNLIQEENQVECPTFRKVVVSESASSDTQKKIKLVLAVKVEKSEVDLQYGTLRVNGKNVKENDWVKLGSYHTLEIELGNWVKIWKAKWDELSIQLVKEASSPTGKCQVGAIILQKGLAHLCTIQSDQNIHVISTIKGNLPKKKFESTSKMESKTGIIFLKYFRL